MSETHDTESRAGSEAHGGSFARDAPISWPRAVLPPAVWTRWRPGSPPGKSPSPGLRRLWPVFGFRSAQPSGISAPQRSHKVGKTALAEAQAKKTEVQGLGDGHTQGPGEGGEGRGLSQLTLSVLRVPKCHRRNGAHCFSAQIG